MCPSKLGAAQSIHPSSTSQLPEGPLKRNFMPNVFLGRLSTFSSRVSRYLDELRVRTPLKKSEGGKEWAWGSLAACCPGMRHLPKQQLLSSPSGLVLAKKQLESVILSMLDFWERKDIFKILCLGSSQGHRQAYRSHYPWLTLPPSPVSAISTCTNAEGYWRLILRKTAFKLQDSWVSSTELSSDARLQPQACTCAARAALVYNGIFLHQNPWVLATVWILASLCSREWEGWGKLSCLAHILISVYWLRHSGVLEVDAPLKGACTFLTTLEEAW